EQESHARTLHHSHSQIAGNPPVHRSLLILSIAVIASTQSSLPCILFGAGGFHGRNGGVVFATVFHTSSAPRSEMPIQYAALPPAYASSPPISPEFSGQARCVAVPSHAVTCAIHAAGVAISMYL